jgi:hypothetical protein
MERRSFPPIMLKKHGSAFRFLRRIYVDPPNPLRSKKGRALPAKKDGRIMVLDDSMIQKLDPSALPMAENPDLTGNANAVEIRLNKKTIR